MRYAVKAFSAKWGNKVEVKPPIQELSQEQVEQLGQTLSQDDHLVTFVPIDRGDPAIRFRNGRQLRNKPTPTL